MGELLTPTHFDGRRRDCIRALRGKETARVWQRAGDGLRGFEDAMKGLTDEFNQSGETPAITTAKGKRSK
jgi:hypothetical protein